MSLVMQCPELVPTTSPNYRRPRVLVVDDATPARAFLADSLMHEGYDVIDAVDGSAAIELIAAGRADLVIADALLPGIDGMEVCRRTRQDLGKTDLPFIVMTARDDRLSRIKDVGADDFVTKPIDLSELCVRVKKLLQVKAEHDSQTRALTTQLEGATHALMDAERLAFLGVTAGSIGHELGNVLAVLMSAGKGIEAAIAAQEKVDIEDVRDLMSAIEHVREHTKSLVMIGRPARAREDTYDIGELIRESVRMLERAGRLRDVNFEVALRVDEPMLVHTNRVRIEQVVLNLVSNAADALVSSGKPHAQRKVIVELLKVDDLARVSIIDNGHGIPASLIEHIFEPYFTTKPIGKGTGLGLPVSRKIISGYGRDLHVESQEGEGAKFWFELPLVPVI